MAKRWYLDIGKSMAPTGNFVRVYLSRRFYTSSGVAVNDPYNNTGEDGQFTKEFVEMLKLF